MIGVMVRIRIRIKVGARVRVKVRLKVGVRVRVKDSSVRVWVR